MKRLKNEQRLDGRRGIGAFDGPKDLFTYYLNPGKYNPGKSVKAMTAIRVKDYYSLAVIDGRKRRRCLLESARLLSPTGYAILHDAWRSYYHCAFNSFRSGRRFGDEWWIGSNIDTTFEDVLPRHAFERHAIVEESLDEESMS